MFNPFTALMIRKSGMSWWQARYSDGRILSEWNTMANKIPGSSRWEEIPKNKMIGLRLLCPNGLAGELEAPEGFKFFQLKIGFMDVAMSGGKSSRSIGAHLIGVVQDIKGTCLCKAWDYKTRRLLTFTDNIYNMKFENLGPLSLEVQSIRI